MGQESLRSESRVIAALGYPFGVLALIVLLTDMKRDHFMRYHALQAVGFIVVGAVVILGLSILGVFVAVFPALWPVFFLMPLASLAWIVLTFFYAHRAYHGLMFEIPVVRRFIRKYVTSSG